MSNGLHDLYQEIILDHNKHPRHYGALADATHKAEGYNPLCGDRIEVYMNVEDGQIQSIQFESASCAIVNASASMMTEALVGKSISEADSMFEAVDEMLNGDGEPPETDEKGEIAALAGVKKFPARIKCATLPWETYRAAVRGEAKMVTE